MTGDVAKDRLKLLTMMFRGSKLVKVMWQKQMNLVINSSKMMSQHCIQNVAHKGHPWISLQLMLF